MLIALPRLTALEARAILDGDSSLLVDRLQTAVQMRQPKGFVTLDVRRTRQGPSIAIKTDFIPNLTSIRRLRVALCMCTV